MKLIEVARQQKDLLNEGIAYIAVWAERQNNGKSSWFTDVFFPDGGTDKETPVFGDEQRARLAEIAAIDANAILLNGYYDSWIGSADEPLNAASIAEGLKKHYDMHNGLISGYLSGEGGTEDFSTSGENARATAFTIQTIPVPKNYNLTRRETSAFYNWCALV